MAIHIAQVSIGGGSIAGRTSRKTPPKDKAVDPVPPVRKVRLHIPALAVLSADLRSLLLNLCLLVIVAVMIPVVALQFTRAQVIRR